MELPIRATASSGLGSSSATPASRDETKVRDAAQQFEALLIQQMLRSAREAESGGGLGSEDHSNDSIRDYAEQQIAQVLSASGGMGLSKLIVQGLNARPAGDGPPPKSGQPT